MKIFYSNGRYQFLNYSKILDRLEPKVYQLRYDENLHAFYLQDTEPYVFPEKIYGNLKSLAEMYVRAFNRGGNLGILLNGEKGSGKTLLTKLICKEANLPVIQIDEAFNGSAFLQLINGITQKCIIVIDEFDKLYAEYAYEGSERPSQTELLKLMDGTSRSEKLFIFSSNENIVSSFMTNRPSRIRYKQEFGKLTHETVVEILQDKLSPEMYEKFVNDFYEVIDILFGVNLDTLLVLIDEVEFQQQSPKEVIKYMNIIPEAEMFNICIDYNGKRVESDGPQRCRPLKDLSFPVYHWFDDEDIQAIGIKALDRIPTKYNLTATANGLVFTHPTGYTMTFLPATVKNPLVF